MSLLLSHTSGTIASYSAVSLLYTVTQVPESKRYPCLALSVTKAVYVWPPKNAPSSGV